MSWYARPSRQNLFTWDTAAFAGRPRVKSTKVKVQNRFVCRQVSEGGSISSATRRGLGRIWKPSPCSYVGKRANPTKSEAKPMSTYFFSLTLLFPILQYTRSNKYNNDTINSKDKQKQVKQFITHQHTQPHRHIQARTHTHNHIHIQTYTYTHTHIPSPTHTHTQRMYYLPRLSIYIVNFPMRESM